ncbi:MAG: hypothetical protein C4519_25040 [Desulfobacteraceae bacterium]|nr:MAG: hypothetical protein C4519_25040 [Desulfobacteraceae bacterium]
MAAEAVFQLIVAAAPMAHTAFGHGLGTKGQVLDMTFQTGYRSLVLTTGFCNFGGLSIMTLLTVAVLQLCGRRARFRRIFPGSRLLGSGKRRCRGSTPADHRSGSNTPVVNRWLRASNEGARHQKKRE